MIIFTYTWRKKTRFLQKSNAFLILNSIPVSLRLSRACLGKFALLLQDTARHKRRFRVSAPAVCQL
jgi:hypothetical protein